MSHIIYSKYQTDEIHSMFLLRENILIYVSPPNICFQQLRLTRNLIHMKTSLCQFGKVIIWRKTLEVQSVLIAIHALSFGCQKSILEKMSFYWVKIHLFVPSCTKLMPTNKIAKAIVNITNSFQVYNRICFKHFANTL